MKRIISLLCLLACFAFSMLAGQEYTITLDKGNNQRQSIELPYGNISLELVSTEGNSGKVVVSIENTTPTQAILLFKNSMDEKILKRRTPKIEFEKTYPGQKGARSVYGCKYVSRYCEPIIPAETVKIFTIDVSTKEEPKLNLPLYLAKYNTRKLFKSGKNYIGYKILSEDVVDINIQLNIWDKNDPEYVKIKKEVDIFIDSLNRVQFCTNRRHVPSADQQRRPYQIKKDSLISVMEEELKNPEWMSEDEPYKAYNDLLDQVKDIDLLKYNGDCGKHKSQKKNRHLCSYCSLNSQQIYHSLDDLYQQLHAGRISKEAAVNKAKLLNACYKNNAKRKKDRFYTDKITGFYNRLVNH